MDTRILARDLAWAALALSAGSAAAAEFTLNPTRVHLDRARAIETLVLGNGEAQPISFEVEIRRWTQGADGQWTLTPSQDIVVHPLIVTIPAGGKARLRVGTLSPGVAAEQAYRVELQQLPGARPTEGANVTLLTRLSVPVFVQPVQRERRAALSQPRVETGAVRVTLDNPGASYVAPQDATLRVLDAGGRELLSESIAVGYVLTGARLPLARPLAPGLCARAARIELELHEPAGTLAAAIAPGARRCAP